MGKIKEAAKRNLALSIGRWNNAKYNLKKKLLITCNLKKGWLKRGYVEPFFQGVLALSKKFIQAFATDNKHGDSNYIKSLSEEKDHVTRQRLWEGNWDYDDDKGALMKHDNVRDIFTNTIVIITRCDYSSSKHHAYSNRSSSRSFPYQRCHGVYEVAHQRLDHWRQTHLLAIIAIIGAIAYSALNGTPLDVKSVTSLGQVAFEAMAAFLAAHGSYSLLRGARFVSRTPKRLTLDYTR